MTQNKLQPTTKLKKSRLKSLLPQERSNFIIIDVINDLKPVTCIEKNKREE